MDDEQKKHLEKVIDIFVAKFIESVRESAEYLDKEKLDTETASHILNKAYEHQLLSILLSLFGNLDTVDFLNAVGRISAAFAKHCETVREYNELFLLVNKMMGKE